MLIFNKHFVNKMKPIIIIVFITIILCIVLYNMSSPSFFNAPAKCPPGSTRVNGKCVKSGASSSNSGKKCLTGYTKVNGKCVLNKKGTSSDGGGGGGAGGIPPSNVYVPGAPVPINSNPWDNAIAANNAAQQAAQQSQQRPNANNSGASNRKCRPGFVIYNNKCVPFKPQEMIGLPSSVNSGGESEIGSQTGLGVDTRPRPQRPQPQQGRPQQQPQRPQPQQPQQQPGGSSMEDRGALALLASAMIVSAVQEAKKQGLTWTQVMSKYPNLAQLPFAARDNLHRDYIGEPTVDHDATGMPIMSRSLFGGIV